MISDVAGLFCLIPRAVSPPPPWLCSVHYAICCSSRQIDTSAVIIRDHYNRDYLIISVTLKSARAVTTEDAKVDARLSLLTLVLRCCFTFENNFFHQFPFYQSPTTPTVEPITAFHNFFLSLSSLSTPLLTESCLHSEGGLFLTVESTFLWTALMLKGNLQLDSTTRGYAQCTVIITFYGPKTLSWNV